MTPEQLPEKTSTLPRDSTIPTRVLESIGGPVLKLYEAIKNQPTILLSMGVKAALHGYGLGWLNEIFKEVEILLKNGKIKKEDLKHQDVQDELMTLLKLVDEGVDEREKLDAIKKIFITGLTVTDQERRITIHQFIMLARRLTSAEILILEAAFRLSKKEQGGTSSLFGADEWFKRVAATSGLKFSILIESSDDSLVSKGLLTKRFHGDLSGVSLGNHFRLTDLAFEFCQFISEYDRLTGQNPA